MRLTGLSGLAVLGGTLVLGAIVTVGVTAPGGGDSAESDRPPSTASTFDISGQPPEIVAEYHFAEAHAGIMSRIPCYCGCGRSLDHGSLLDCFVRTDGEGYEAHAATCLICQEETLDVQRMVNAGIPAGDVRRAIDEEYGRYGPPTDTRPPDDAS